MIIERMLFLRIMNVMHEKNLTIKLIMGFIYAFFYLIMIKFTGRLLLVYPTTLKLMCADICALFPLQSFAHPLTNVHFLCTFYPFSSLILACLAAVLPSSS